MGSQSITFGYFLDGQRPEPASNTMGTSLVGPLGLLGVLETQLGLLALRPAQAERIVQFRNCLEKADSHSRFYHQSFSLDPLGTAATLLGWRDEWLLHGWTGRAEPTDPVRVRDMADVELIAGKTVSPCVGQRLAIVETSLKDRTPDIGVIVHLEEVEFYPIMWQRVLRKLPIAFGGALEPDGEGFLGMLQRKLAATNDGQASSKIRWEDDRTVIAVQAESQTLAHRWLATLQDSPASTLLVCEKDGARLDSTLVAAGRARQGLKNHSAFRPALQVLPLALDLLWAPLNFGALVQFLTHPICPVRGSARRRIARKIADSPGIGGEKWERMLREIDAEYGEQASQVRAEIAQWIEHERFPAATGAPLDAVIDRVTALVGFFRLRLGDSNDGKRLAFNAGYGQCRACLESLRGLKVQGATTIRPRQLQKLVAQATSGGVENPLWAAEVGALQFVTKPGAVTKSTGRVIWSSMSMPALPTDTPWSQAEMLALHRAGATIPSYSQRLIWEATAWLRPVFAAREQLVLMLPPPGTEVHPLWQMICTVADKPIVQPLEALLTQPLDEMCQVSKKQLPSRKRWWQLPAGVHIPLRERESFSSLEKFIFNPYQWVLEHPAKLRPSRMVSLGNDFRMYGTLAHDLVENFYLRPDALQMSAADFEKWFDATLNALIDQEGAVLRTPGRGAELEGYRQKLHRAMVGLREHVALAGVVKVIPEREMKGHFVGGDLGGWADLVMENKLGHHSIVDMKWAGYKKYKEKLKQNSHLQLATYAELYRQETGRVPGVSYYILDSAKLMAADRAMFADAEVVESQEGENSAQLWMRFVETWKWRAQQIKAGQIEVAMESIPTDESSTPPENGLPMEYLNSAYNDYINLAGWED